MFKIILADDEPVIIRGLKKLIAWDKLDAQVIADACDGEELLGKVRKLQPDIIISDVAMPKMTGLDVIEEIRKNHWNVKVIFLSGYQEFDYVKTALSREAVDYLLKPVGKEELEHAITRAEQMLRADHPMEYWQAEKNDVEQVFKKINSEYESRNLYQHFQEIGIEIQGKIFAGISLMLPPSFAARLEDQNMFELMRFTIFQKIHEHLKQNKNGFVIKRDTDIDNLILLGDDEGSIEEEISWIRRWIREQYHVGLVVGIGRTAKQISELKYAYKTAKFSCQLYYFCEEEVIRYDQISREFHSSFDDYTACYGRMRQAVFHRSGEWKDCLKELMDIIENLHYGNRYAAENRCVAMLLDLLREIQEYTKPAEKDRKSYETFVSNIRQVNTYRELRIFIRKNLQWFIDEILSQENVKEKDVIRQVKYYIREHYAEDIRLGKIADMVYMNPYYFSSFFKKETGQNFKNYLIEVRMKAAGKLLMESDVTSYHLASAVGYKDVKSFVEKFREYYGDTPTEYKKNRKENGVF